MLARMDETTPTDASALPGDVRAAGERALQRLAERRAAADPETVAARELRATLSRAENQIEAIREATSELRAVLPTRVEAAVARALSGHEGATLARRVDETRSLAGEAATGVRALAGDLERERIARLEDLEVLVELVASGLGATRGDVARAGQRLAALERRLAEATEGVARVEAAVAATAETSARLEERVDGLHAMLDRLAPLVERVAVAAERPFRFTLDRERELEGD